MKSTKMLTTLVVLLVLGIAGISKGQRKMYWTDATAGKNQRANLDGSAVEDLTTSSTPTGIAIDIAGGKMYWASMGTGKIYRTNLDGSGSQTLVAGLSTPYDICLDIAVGKMYWTDFGSKKIQRANLDGSNVQDVITGLSNPRGMDLDIAGGKIYWADSGPYRIRRANMDGSAIEDVVTGLDSPHDVAVDIVGGKIYWPDFGTKKIQRANLDGSGVEDLVTGLTYPYGIALDIVKGKMYWADYSTGKIQRANLDGSSVEDVVTGLSGPRLITVLPPTITYQGRLLDNSSVADGLYDLRFSAYNEEGDVNALTVAGAQDVDVIDGYFTIQLGLDGVEFNGDGVHWLEIAVRDANSNDPNAYVALSPRQQLTSTPYAVYAENSGADNDWTISGNNMYSIPSGNVGIGNSNPSSPLDVIGEGTHTIRAQNTADTNSATALYGKSDSTRGCGVRAVAGAGSGSTYGVDAYVASPDGIGVYAFNEAESGNAYAIYGENGSPDGIALLAHASNSSERSSNIGVYGRTDGDYGAAGVYGEATNTGGNNYGVKGHTNNATGFAGYFTGGRNYFEGSVGIGTTNPEAKLHIRSTQPEVRFEESDQSDKKWHIAGYNSGLVFAETGEGNAMYIDEGGRVGIGTTSPAQKLDVSGYVVASRYYDRDDTSYYLDPGSTGYSATFAGNVGIGTTAPSSRLHIEDSTTGDVSLKIHNLNNTGTERLYFGSSTSDAVMIVWGSSNTTYPGKWRFSNNKTSANFDWITSGSIKMTLANNGNLGIGTTAPAAKLDVAGRIRTEVLEITGGSDLSEQFEIKGEEQKVEPGMVVCIDPDSCGNLVVSQKAYDRTVAGIVSGAGGVKPGMLMGQQGTMADGEHPVALTGRVYCRADASKGPITPGDLLTTSDVAGHAMKVTDYNRAQGAILGKAMSSLNDGRGLVLVLVTLQ